MSDVSEENFLDYILLEWKYRCKAGYPVMTNGNDIAILKEILSREVGVDFAGLFIGNLTGENPIKTRLMETTIPPVQAKKFSGITINSIEKHINNIRGKLDSLDENARHHAEQCADMYSNYALTETENDRAYILEQMIRAGYIECNVIEDGIKSRKIYATAKTGLWYRDLNSTGNNLVHKDMHNIAEAYNIDIPIRADSKNKQLARAAGYYSEWGLAYLLDPSEDNEKNYMEVRENVKKLGGNLVVADVNNVKAADIVIKSLAEDYNADHIVSARSIGKDAAATSEAKVDSTDVVIKYIAEGSEKEMRISIKNASNLSATTLRIAGYRTFGENYIGGALGEALDKRMIEEFTKLKWQKKGYITEEVDSRKRKWRQYTVKECAGVLHDLSKTDDGQQKLLEIWNKIQSVGKCHTLMIDKKGNVDPTLLSPDYFANPTLPFTVDVFEMRANIVPADKRMGYVEFNTRSNTEKSPELRFAKRSFTESEIEQE